MCRRAIGSQHLAGDRREGVRAVARRSRQAIEARDHEHVVGVELGEYAAELGAIGLRAAHGARRRKGHEGILSLNARHIDASEK
jgi:hypothetical protein